MRSRAEGVLRLAAVALLAWALWVALRPAAATAVALADAASLRASLERWTTSAPPTRVHVTLGGGDVLPGYARQWLVGLRRDGVPVDWGQPAGSTSPLLASAIDAEAVADPRGATRVRVAAPGGASVLVRDALGALDSVRVAASGQGATVLIPATLRGIDGIVGGTTARGAVIDSLTLRHLLVLGRADWESKFLVRSLEEEGWTVDLHLGVAPKNDVIEGKPAAIDTATYAAVIAVDSSAAPAAPRIAAYVKSGGGLVVAGSAAQVFRELDSGVPGARVRDAEGAPSDSAPRGSLGLLPVTGLAGDAVVLELRAGTALVAVAARRVGAGRVVQVGYDDTWRWRMAGGDSSAARHRAWWAAVVSSVAYAPRSARPVPADVDVAPLAHLVDALGAPSAPAQHTALERVAIDPTRSPWIFGVLLAALLVEWASRRLRGRR
jgi:hypothetical protein